MEKPPREVLADPAAGAEDLLTALVSLRRVRADLDATERALIERAREQRIAWPRIAGALGLRSRQAAEQRLLRLSADCGRDPAVARVARERQRNADVMHGKPIAALRVAARDAYRRVLADPAWDGRHPRATLVRTSLAEATNAQPSALFALVDAALADLAAMPPDAGFDPLRRAVAAARPLTPGGAIREH
jgi:hypothetical protein